MLGGIWSRVKGITNLTGLRGKTSISEEELMNLEETLIEADFGVRFSQELTGWIRKNGVRGEDILSTLQGRVVEILNNACSGNRLGVSSNPGDCTVYMVVGANGVGKTTTIAKLAHRLKTEGHKVILAAADTFRAGAIDQIKIWGGRIGIEVISQNEGADPSSVVFDAIDAARARGADFLICDTSGRLHTHNDLMDELRKMKRMIAKKVDGAPHETLLILDATTGQNAIIQAGTFKKYLDVSGVILAKLDGTAKGGSVVAITHETGLAVKMVGLGEALDDLVPFDPSLFVKGLLS
ncbi:MAG: signal recognition particle-docking protein FtsY [Candidatus Glassbacteria bacterium]